MNTSIDACSITLQVSLIKYFSWKAMRVKIFNSYLFQVTPVGFSNLCSIIIFLKGLIEEAQILKEIILKQLNGNITQHRSEARVKDEDCDRLGEPT
jgi:hypothetical protein